MSNVKLKQLIPPKFCLACDGCCRFNQPETVWAPYGIKLVHHKEEIYLCPHFEFETRICKIYASRPLDCVLYPFVLDRQGDKIYLALDAKCPFAKARKDAPELKEYAASLLRALCAPTLRAYLEQHKQEIPHYPEDLIIFAALDNL